MLNKEKVDTIIADTSIRLGILSEFQFSVISAFAPIVKNIKENINLIQDAFPYFSFSRPFEFRNGGMLLYCNIDEMLDNGKSEIYVSDCDGKKVSVWIIASEVPSAYSLVGDENGLADARDFAEKNIDEINRAFDIYCCEALKKNTVDAVLWGN